MRNIRKKNFSIPSNGKVLLLLFKVEKKITVSVKIPSTLERSKERKKPFKKLKVVVVVDLMVKVFFFVIL